MGIHFSDTVPTFNGLNTYPVPPLTASVEFHQDLTNKTDWTRLDTVYIANGTERFITIGNMRDNTQCHGIYVGGNQTCSVNYCWYAAEYLVDDVFVELLDETASPFIAKNEAISILPNPNNGSFKIKTDAFTKPIAFVITDALGHVIDDITLTGSSTNYANKNLPKGIYFYTLHSNGVVTSRGKFLVQK